MKSEKLTHSLSDILRIGSLVACLLIATGGQAVWSQPCGSSPPECQPLTQGHGPDPCDAKVYCSNSGAVETGLINCTTAADTDGCGVEAFADVDTVEDVQLFVDEGVPSECYLDPDDGQPYTYVQWIKFTTPPNINSVKLQGVGQMDAWVVFHAGSEPFDGNYSFPDCNTLMYVDGACSDVNQWKIWVNPDAVIDDNTVNVYYIALFYDDKSNGSINFKVKECELVETCVPEILCPPESECLNTDQEIEDWYNLVEFGGCGDGVRVSAVPESGDLVECIENEVVFTLVDMDGTPISHQGQIVRCTSTVKVDREAPVISTEASSGDLGCNPTVVPPIFTATDNCDDDLSPDVTDTGPMMSQDTGGGQCEQYSQTWTANVSDGCGNDADEVSITWTWRIDSEAPLINTTDVSEDKGCGDPGEPSFTAEDNCDGVLIPVVETDGATMIDNGIDACTDYTQTWTANVSDGCGNDADEVSITWTWRIDEAKPVISTSAIDDDLGCNPTITAPTFTAEDNCDGVLVPVVETDGATMVDNGNDACTDYTQTWTANVSDGCGNDADEVSITWTWRIDSEAPLINTTDVSEDKGCGDPGEPSFTAEDNCDGVLIPVVETDGATMIDNGIDACTDYTQTWTANVSDGCGNDADEVSITWTWRIDEAKPVISTSAIDDDLGCNPTITAPTFTAEDNCDGVLVPVVETDGATMVDNGNDACTDYTQTWTANVSDGCGNDADEVSITWTWRIDSEAPLINTTDVSEDKGCGDPGEPSFTAEDNCDGVLIPVVETDGATMIDNGIDACTDYTQTWTANVSDGCGNDADEVSITWTWRIDEAKPVISTSAIDDDLGCNPTITAPTFTAEDNCDGVLVPVVETDGATMVDNGNDACTDYTQTWTANVSDGCGNDADEVSITWTWRIDNTPPTFTKPDDLTIECGPVPAPTDPTVSDNCSGDVVIVYQGQDIDADQERPISYCLTRTWKAADACDNTAFTTQTICVTDCCSDETAFALGNADDCIAGKGKSNNWGFYIPLDAATICDEEPYPLIAGAGQCDPSKGLVVGTVTVECIGTSIVVTYALDDNTGYPYFELGTVHVYLDCSLPKKFAPGQFPYKDSSNDGLTASVTIDYDELSSCHKGKGFLIAHAEVEVCEQAPLPGLPDAGPALETIFATQGDAQTNTFSVRAYPNPASQFVYLNVSGIQEDHLEVDLYDMLGRVVRKYDFSVERLDDIQLELPTTARKGLHYLLVRSGDQWKTVPIVLVE